MIPKKIGFILSLVLLKGGMLCFCDDESTSYEQNPYPKGEKAQAGFVQNSLKVAFFCNNNKRIYIEHSLNINIPAKLHGRVSRVKIYSYDLPNVECYVFVESDGQLYYVVPDPAINCPKEPGDFVYVQTQQEAVQGFKEFMQDASLKEHQYKVVEKARNSGELIALGKYFYKLQLGEDWCIAFILPSNAIKPDGFLCDKDGNPKRNQN